MRVLIAYATADGSTREIADRIAVRLRERDYPTDVSPADGVREIAAYDAVLIGSAVHSRQWLEAAIAFLHAHRGALAERPLWVFSVGMPDSLPRFLRKLARTEETGILSHLDGLEPEGHRLFSGVVRPGQFPFASRVFLRMVGGRYGNFRDWAAIDQWAATIAARLDEFSRRSSMDTTGA